MIWARPSAAEISKRRASERADRMSALCRPICASTAVMGGGTRGAVPKENVLKSAAYENAVRAIGYCVRCGCACRPQFCHRDEGKGTGIKTDCREGWAGCAACHFYVGTSGSLPKERRRAEDLRLGEKTRAILLRTGTWPKSVAKLEEQTA